MATMASNTVESPPVTPPNRCDEAAVLWGLGPMGEWLHHAITSGFVGHGWVFKGQDVPGMYRLSMVLAKVLNCSEPIEPGVACGQCRDCRWADANAHPALLTLCRYTFLDDKTFKEVTGSKARNKKTIGVKQLGAVLGNVAMRSDYTRVVILTDVDMVPVKEKGHLSEATLGHIPAPAELTEWATKKNTTFVPASLSPAVFAAEPANKLLKTLEEPPPRCLFVFLTDDEQNLMDTITSRCQQLAFTAPPQAALAAPVADSGALDALLDTLWEGLPPTTNMDDLYQQLFEAAGTSPDWALVLAYWQQRWGQQWRQQASTATKSQVQYFNKRLQALEDARLQIKSYVHTEATLRQLLFALCHEI